MAARPPPAAERHLRATLALARRAAGRTSPNPIVGAVVASGDRVVGRGFHERAGGPHAEVVALAEAGRRARGATLYVNLEPCAHHGKTPPCTEAIVQAGIRRVVIGMRDPNPVVNGRGIRRLRRAGIEVLVGVLEAECRSLNEAYVTFITTGRPFVTLKLAASLDGRIATANGDSRWITGDASRRHVHRLRAQADAVMVGSGTALADDPRLTARAGGRSRARQPTRVVVDSTARTPPQAALFDDTAAVWIATTRLADAARRRALADAGAEVLLVPSRRGRVRLDRLLDELGARGVTNVLVEGGSELAATLVAERLVDKVLFFYAPVVLGGDARPMLGDLGFSAVADASRFRRTRVRRFGDDLMVEAVPCRD